MGRGGGGGRRGGGGAAAAQVSAWRPVSCLPSGTAASQVSGAAAFRAACRPTAPTARLTRTCWSTRTARLTRRFRGADRARAQCCRRAAAAALQSPFKSPFSRVLGMSESWAGGASVAVDRPPVRPDGGKARAGPAVWRESASSESTGTAASGGHSLAGKSLTGSAATNGLMLSRSLGRVAYNTNNLQ